MGLLGLPILILGVAGFVAGYKYDTWFGGQQSDLIGENQRFALIGAGLLMAAGVFLTLLGFVRAKSPAVSELAPMPAQETERASDPVVAAAPSVRVSIPEPEEEPMPRAREEPELYPAEPAAEPAVAAAEVEAPAPPAEVEEEEDEGDVDFDIPAPPVAAPSPAPPPAAPAAPPAAAVPAERDELEDLFGELESEVAKADEEAVHYECPNCHGLVGEDDTTCPHCGVTFEG